MSAPASIREALARSDTASPLASPLPVAAPADIGTKRDPPSDLLFPSRHRGRSGIVIDADGGDLRLLRQPLDGCLDILFAVKQHPVMGCPIDESARPLDVAQDNPQKILLRRAETDRRVNRQNPTHNDEQAERADENRGIPAVVGSSSALLAPRSWRTDPHASIVILIVEIVNGPLRSSTHDSIAPGTISRGINSVIA